MRLVLAPASSADEARLAALFELYIYDFSDLLGLDVGDDGRFRAPPLGGYFVDPERHAFLLHVDDRLAGFALVHERSRLTGERGVFDMAEFFVMRLYRRRGLGEAMATSLFDRFRGPWEVRQKPENTAATAFWRRVIAKRTGARWQEDVREDERWHGLVQRFDSSSLP
jgi:predicted acetyltransferase